MPPLWWHHVRSDGALNVLVNYWFGQRQDRFPFAALMLAMHSIRELPDSERGAWRTWFDHYVFGDGATHAVDHLPPHAQGVLGPPSPQRRSEEHTSELQSLMRISYAVFCLKKKNTQTSRQTSITSTN